MHQLVLVTYDAKFEEAIAKVQWSQRSPGPGDNMLAIYLAKEDIQQELLPELARVASKVLGTDVSFTLLIEAINKRLPGLNSNPRFYNKDTIGESHILFLACLVSMASAHTQLEKMLYKYPQVGDKRELGEAPAGATGELLKALSEMKLQFHIVTAFQMLLHYTRLFIYLISSPSFKSHLEILNRFLADSLVPNREFKKTYERWAKQHVFCNFRDTQKDLEKEKGFQKWWGKWGKNENSNENENENRNGNRNRNENENESTSIEDADDNDNDPVRIFFPL
jgi:hypothetical protein